VCIFLRRLFWDSCDEFISERHVITLLFINVNSFFNYLFYTRDACFVKHNARYKKCTKIKDIC